MGHFHSSHSHPGCCDQGKVDPARLCPPSFLPGRINSFRTIGTIAVCLHELVHCSASVISQSYIRGTVTSKGRQFLQSPGTHRQFRMTDMKHVIMSHEAGCAKDKLLGRVAQWRMPFAWKLGLGFVSCFLAYYKLAKIHLVLSSEPILQSNT